MDRIDLFRIFARVVECASFTRAADMLGMPRSSVSLAIQELEARVGARLLHRTTRKVSPTLDGDAFYVRCVRVIEDVTETENLFRSVSGGPRGRLRVDMPGRIGRLIVAPLLPEFLQAYPGIDISLGITDRAVNMVEEGVDCVLRVGDVSASGLITRYLGDISFVNVASPDYLARRDIPQHPDDLSEHEVVLFASPSTGRVEEWEWVDGEDLCFRPVTGRVTVNGAEASIACCLAGMGLIQIPAYDVRTHIKAGDLVEVMPEYRAAPMPVSLVYPHRRHLSQRLKLFSDWLAKIILRDITD